VPGDVVLAIADGEQVVATLRRGPDGFVLVDASGRDLPAGEASARGTVTWSLRGFRDGPPPGAGFGFLVPAPASTFMFAVDGSSMRGAGIRDGDVLVVDRALPPGHGDVVVASVGGGRTVKRLVTEGGRARLAFEEDAEDLRFLPLNPEDTLFGVVTWCLHRMRAPAAPRGRRR
jgi:SOS-response transcriptional repressor LexA